MVPQEVLLSLRKYNFGLLVCQKPDNIRLLLNKLNTCAPRVLPYKKLEQIRKD
jgi:hypothetical protein